MIAKVMRMKGRDKEEGQVEMQEEEVEKGVGEEDGQEKTEKEGKAMVDKAGRATVGKEGKVEGGVGAEEEAGAATPCKISSSTYKKTKKVSYIWINLLAPLIFSRSIFLSGDGKVKKQRTKVRSPAVMDSEKILADALKAARDAVAKQLDVTKNR